LNRLKGVLPALVIALALSFAASGAAGTADEGPNGEQVAVSMTIKPRGGPLYRAGSVPVNARIDVGVSAPSGQMYVTPTRAGKVRFPDDIILRPRGSLPACTDAKLNAAMDLSIPPAEVIAKCPESVIGNGSSTLYLSGMKTAAVQAVMVIFHAGLTSEGRPRLKLWGYTKNLTAGLLMQGTLRPDNSLKIVVPSLPLKTAIGEYSLNVPGTAPIIYDGKPVPGSVGLDPSYVKARCGSGEWLLSATATLGKYFDDGRPDGPAYHVPAPDFRLPCVGRPGRPPGGPARIGRVSVNGPGRVKRGRSAIFRVGVSNPGGTALGAGRIVARGRGARGSAALGRVPAGGRRTVPLRVRFARKGRVRVAFTLRGRTGTAKTVTRTVKVS